MKRFCVCLCSVALSISLFSQSVGDVSALIDMGIEKNMEQITTKASSLSSSDKMMLYTLKKKDATIPFVVNLLVGFGIGSYIQGDTFGGTVGLVGSLGSVVAFNAGYWIADYGLKNVIYDNLVAPGMITWGVGALGIIAFGIFNWVRPFVYSGDYNKNLQAALGYSGLAFDIVPTIDSVAYGKNVDQRFGLALQGTF